MEHTSSSMLALPRPSHALRMQHSRNAFMAPQYIHCVCGVCVGGYVCGVSVCEMR